MSKFRSYFSKNNTIIESNYTNNSQNPVTEISYGTDNNDVSRYIFDVNLDELINKINDGYINKNSIVKHILHITNTLSKSPKYLGNLSYDSKLEYTSGFDLEFFEISQDWDEGNGYDLIFNENLNKTNKNYNPSNWYYSKNNIKWNYDGIYNDNSVIIATQHFDKGNEDINIDVTDYINNKLNNTNKFGIGIKFTNNFENLNTDNRRVVSFHTKYTNTIFEPYIETIIDDKIIDDRNYFYLDKNNSLYLYSVIGGVFSDVKINNVKIYDYNNKLYTTITEQSIIKVKKGIYKINLNINSNEYPDSVMFRDEWNITINNNNIIHKNKFYILSLNNYYNFNLDNNVNLNNYYLHIWGIDDNDSINTSEIKNIKLSIKKLYPNQNNNIPLDIEYRIFSKISNNIDYDIIPYTDVNRTSNSYEFDIDTSWLIPNDYYLQVRLKNGQYSDVKKTIKFKITKNLIEFEDNLDNNDDDCGLQYVNYLMFNNVLLYNCKIFLDDNKVDCGLQYNNYLMFNNVLLYNCKIFLDDNTNECGYQFPTGYIYKNTLLYKCKLW